MKQFLDLFYPRICMGCSDLVNTKDEILCLRCRHDLPLTNHHLETENEFYRKLFGRLDIENAAAMVYFHKKGIVQELIHNLKYRNHPEIGTLLGEWYGEVLLENEIYQNIDCIIPVPLHPNKLKERGYNQVENFAKTIAKKLNKPYYPNVLKREKYSKTQVFKNILNRTDIIDKVFDLNTDEQHKGQHFLLIDDVITTGSTLESCGKALLSIPNSRLSLLTIGFAH